MCVCVLTVSVVRINKRKLKMSNQITAFFLSWTHFFSIFRENKSTSHWIHLVVVPSSHSYFISHLSKILRMTVVWAGFSGVNDIYRKMKCDVSLVYVNRERERETHTELSYERKDLRWEFIIFRPRIHSGDAPVLYPSCDFVCLSQLWTGWHVDSTIVLRMRQPWNRRTCNEKRVSWAHVFNISHPLPFIYGSWISLRC